MDTTTDPTAKARRIRRLGPLFGLIIPAIGALFVWSLNGSCEDDFSCIGLVGVAIAVVLVLAPFAALAMVYVPGVATAILGIAVSLVGWALIGRIAATAGKGAATYRRWWIRYVVAVALYSLTIPFVVIAMV